jgi:uncharacterized membrane protein
MTSFFFGAPQQWMTVAIVVLGLAFAALVWGYFRAPARPILRTICLFLKLAGFAALAVCMLEPTLAGSSAKRGANVFAILADNSQSMRIRADDAGATRGDWLRSLLADASPWKTRLGQDFDLRQFLFDSQLHSVDTFASLNDTGSATALVGSLTALEKRFRGLPVAGILLFTDGNGTDLRDVDWSTLPPVYPVMPPSRKTVKDISVPRVALSQTNFEEAPVVLQATVVVQGLRGRKIVAAVLNEQGKELERQTQEAAGDDALHFRFQLRPERPGVSFYKVAAFLDTESKLASPAATVEETLANNSRLVVVDRGGGPFRILYVGGRPNWEFKYLRRSVEEDPELGLVGLIRIAKRQPKFDFRAARDRNNQLFKNFEDPNADTAERVDQPVLVRLGTIDETELRKGFPETAEELYRYHAVVLDDIEAEFFKQEQLALLRNFVSVRGGGFLMLGGPGSFTDGKYNLTPVGELLPVYLDKNVGGDSEHEYKLVLTREGWLQPWVRTRKTEDEESKRIDAMSTFLTLNHAGAIKPGATVLAEVKSGEQTLPALVTQSFGKGRSSALLIGDLWRWGLRREDHSQKDFERSWRQTMRWLVGNVPGRVEVTAAPHEQAASGALEVRTRVLDPMFLPLDNAAVTLRVTQPDKSVVTLTADAAKNDAGQYVTTFVPRIPGIYRGVITANAPDGSLISEREVGWTSQPEADEFARLEPNKELLETIAAKTGGQVIARDGLDAFARGLPFRQAPIMEAWTFPLWHHFLYLLITIACLTAEWGLRRMSGLA